MSRPTWVVVVIAWDGTGETDEWTEVVCEAGLNRRQAIAAGTEGLPGDAGDPLLQRMIAYHLEAKRTLEIPKFRIAVCAMEMVPCEP